MTLYKNMTLYKIKQHGSVHIHSRRSSGYGADTAFIVQAVIDGLPIEPQMYFVSVAVHGGSADWFASPARLGRLGFNRGTAPVGNNAGDTLDLLKKALQAYLGTRATLGSDSFDAQPDEAHEEQPLKPVWGLSVGDASATLEWPCEAAPESTICVKHHCFQLTHSARHDGSVRSVPRMRLITATVGGKSVVVAMPVNEREPLWPLHFDGNPRNDGSAPALLQPRKAVTALLRYIGRQGLAQMSDTELFAASSSTLDRVVYARCVDAGTDLYNLAGGAFRAIGAI